MSKRIPSRLAGSQRKRPRQCLFVRSEVLHLGLTNDRMFDRIDRIFTAYDSTLPQYSNIGSNSTMARVGCRCVEGDEVEIAKYQLSIDFPRACSESEFSDNPPVR